MKITHYENEHGFTIDLTPETPEEVAELARIAMNKSAESVEINLFMSSKPTATIWVKKVKLVSQNNTITRRK